MKFRKFLRMKFIIYLSVFCLTLNVIEHCAADLIEETEVVEIIHYFKQSKDENLMCFTLIHADRLPQLKKLPHHLPRLPMKQKKSVQL